nr:hypothetical protein CFP56_00716 [Quercus suber]
MLCHVAEVMRVQTGGACSAPVLSPNKLAAAASSRELPPGLCSPRWCPTSPNTANDHPSDTAPPVRVFSRAWPMYASHRRRHSRSSGQHCAFSCARRDMHRSHHEQQRPRVNPRGLASHVLYHSVLLGVHTQTHQTPSAHVQWPHWRWTLAISTAHVREGADSAAGPKPKCSGGRCTDRLALAS